MEKLSKNESFNLMLSAVDAPKNKAKIAAPEKVEIYTYQCGKYWYAGVSGRIEVRASSEGAARGKLRLEGFIF